MDVLSLEKIWKDNEFYEVEFKASSEFVGVKTKAYVIPEKISELAKRLSDFPESKNDEFYWESGTKGEGYAPCFSLGFKCDDCGHVKIEVYCEIDDGASLEKHNCCFFVKSEIGLVNRFGKSLFNINNGEIGAKAELNKNSR